MVQRNGYPSDWRCNSCHTERSLTFGTVFYRSRIPLHRILLMILFIYLHVNQKVITYTCNISRWSVAKYQVLARRMERQRLRATQRLLGGPGITVQIDEAILRKRKYHRGKPKRPIWLFGAVEDVPRDRRRAFITVVPNRKAITLIPLIQEHIAPGSTIVSDEWKAYSTLSTLGYKHLTVNHHQSFINHETGVHTNLIEGLWAHLRRSFPVTGIKKQFINQYLTSYLLRLNEQIDFIHYLTDITYYKEQLADAEDSVSVESEHSDITSSEESFEDLAPYPCVGQVNDDDDSETDYATVRAATGEDASEYEDS